MVVSDNFNNRLPVSRKPTITIGLVGGIASGKSEVARMLAEQGAFVFHADREGHELLLHPDIRDAVVREFGNTILDSQQQIDRKQLAERVFGEDEASLQNLRALEKILHPAIRERFHASIKNLRGAPVCRVVLLDAPLLFEAGWEGLCDAVVFVECPSSQRIARASLRGWSEGEFARRESKQLAVEEKRRRSDFIVDNSGTLESLREQVLALWNQLIAMCKVPPYDK